MKSILTKIILFSFLLFFIIINPLQAATERRLALVIGNSAYSSGPLKNPVNDAAAMATMLKKLGFTVTLKKNAKQQEMDESIREFGRQLKRTRSVGLFYYAGHGMQIGGANYLLPVNARIEKESDVRFHSVNADIVLAEMENAENGLNIVILDACRDNPFSRSFRNAARGLAIISNAPSGTFISYSTGANQVARDGEGKNSPYTKAILENMDKPGLSINNVFMKVRSKVKKETGQIPWELSSLEGDFYFVPGQAKKVTDIVPSGNTTTGKEASSFSEKQVTDVLDEESLKLEEEQRKLDEEKALQEKKKSMEEQRRKIATEKQRLEAEKEIERKEKLAMAKFPGKEMIKKDGHFIAFYDGTVLDTQTNLMWAAKDNGSIINWKDAKSFCENYSGGGYTNWRMPTQDELAGLYGNNKSPKSACGFMIHVTTELIDMTCSIMWASETSSGMFGLEAALFNFNDGKRYVLPLSDFVPDVPPRVIPVRSGK